MKKIMYITLSLFFTLNVCAQDIHFSQFGDAPFNLNPGLTGMFDADIRIIGNQRTQWRSVTLPYSTFAIHGDGRDLIKKFKNLSIGAGFSHDKAGDSRLKTTAINLSGAFAKELTNAPEHIFSAGLGLSFHFVGIDYSDLRYDNQWSGIFFDPGINSNENFQRDSRFYPDLSLGLAHEYSSPEGWKATSGIGLYNLMTPQQSFFDITTVRLDPRINFSSAFNIPLSAEWDIQPSTLLSIQGKYKEWNIGSLANYVVMNERSIYRSVYGGLFFRTKDAGYIVAGMRYDDWKVGLSYDINTSNLKPASNGRGGLEIAVVYLINLANDDLLLKKYCPDFF
ncbi:MAG: PorP/SprF family type IX secretion system membrane protein [Flavobacteriales bacterium]|nr:PorP/SprF family type IX secretion system membrane protein [Flavobacteriales bacterium]